ncbi:MAG: MOSC N-terminal beta barrel domain-containing protein [Planctomycetota bacterium]|nr:MOSC N-terminal beta barrel domain-containing protein [Planctomycetota bacterium]
MVDANRESGFDRNPEIDPAGRGLVHSIGIHPIKSLAGLHPERWLFGPDGPLLDRRWMLVDENHRFLSLRELPGLAAFHPSLPDEPSGGLPSFIEVRHEDESIRIHPAESESGGTARLWKADRIVVDEGDEAAEWFSRRVDRTVRLVRHLPDLDPWTQPEPEADGATTGLADGYPVLVLAGSTMRDAVGDRWSRRRFRANIVVEGVAAGAEDLWASIRIGEVHLDLVKPCVRCVATTVDPDEAARTGTEPLATLARTRTWNGKPVLGWNAIVRRPGVVRCGDAVEVVTARDRSPIDQAPNAAGRVPRRTDP